MPSQSPLPPAAQAVAERMEAQVQEDWRVVADRQRGEIDSLRMALTTSEASVVGLANEREALRDDARLFGLMLDSAREDAAHWKAAWEKAARSLSQIADMAREGLMQIEERP